MHRIVRNNRVPNLLRRKILSRKIYPYLCLTCKSAATSFSTLAQRAADGNVPFTEKVRRKIWGTEQPPGQANPYGQTNSLERARPAENETRKKKQRRHNLVAASEGFDQYEPAITWDGLQQVGGPEDMLVKEWLPGNDYKDSFVPKHVMTETDEITANLHRALVEIFVWYQAGYPLADIFMTPKSSVDLTRSVQINYSTTSGVTLQYPEDITREKIIDSLKPTKFEEELSIDDEVPGHVTLEDSSTSTAPVDATEANELNESDSKNIETKDSTEEDLKFESETRSKELDPFESIIDTVNYQELVASWEPSWMEIPLTDPEIKFAVIKRITKLCGIIIPDAAIISMTTAQTLLEQIVKPPKLQKLAEVLVQEGDLIKLPNVSIHPRRISLRDKETAVGRWKLIEEEFIARDIMPEKEI